MQLQITYTAQDSVDAYKAHFSKRAPLIIRIFYAVSVPLGILFALFFGILPALTKKISPASAVLPILMGLWLIYFGISYIARLAKRSFSSRPERQPEYQVVIDSDGVRMRNVLSSTEYKWPCFISFLETKKVVLLYVSVGAFEFFPKRVFSPEQLQEIRVLAAAKVDKAERVAAGLI